MVAPKENTLSVREEVVRNLVSTLEGVTVANGYKFDVERVVRGQSMSRRLKVYPSVYVFEITERKVITPEAPLDLYVCQLTVLVIPWLRDPNVPDRFENVNELVADVKKALLVDGTRNGFALSTKLSGNRQKVTDSLEPYGGSQVTVEITYRHLRTDPSAVR